MRQVNLGCGVLKLIMEIFNSWHARIAVTRHDNIHDNISICILILLAVLGNTLLKNLPGDIAICYFDFHASCLQSQTTPWVWVTRTFQETKTKERNRSSLERHPTTTFMNRCLMNREAAGNTFCFINKCRLQQSNG